MRPIVALLVVLGAAAPVRSEDGATFRARCGSCHGETGRADSMEARALKVPPLQDYKRLRGMTAAEIAALVRRNAKHAVVTNVSDADLLEAAEYVTELVRVQP
jgi:mono/diheme cytochrome c family protein